jgi:hypothetical protein
LDEIEKRYRPASGVSTTFVVHQDDLYYLVNRCRKMEAGIEKSRIDFYNWGSENVTDNDPFWGTWGELKTLDEEK